MKLINCLKDHFLFEFKQYLLFSENLGGTIAGSIYMG